MIYKISPVLSKNYTKSGSVFDHYYSTEEAPLSYLKERVRQMYGVEQVTDRLVSKKPTKTRSRGTPLCAMKELR